MLSSDRGTEGQVLDISNFLREKNYFYFYYNNLPFELVVAAAFSYYAKNFLVKRASRVLINFWK